MGQDRIHPLLGWQLLKTNTTTPGKQSKGEMPTKQTGRVEMAWAEEQNCEGIMERKN